MSAKQRVMAWAHDVLSHYSGDAPRCENYPRCGGEDGRGHFDHGEAKRILDAAQYQGKQARINAVKAAEAIIADMPTCKVCKVYLRDSSNVTITMRLNSYAAEARESKRHRKWLASERWSSQRDPWSDDRAPGFKSLPKPATIPDDVLAEVKQRAMECVQIEVMP